MKTFIVASTVFDWNSRAADLRLPDSEKICSSTDLTMPAITHHTGTFRIEFYRSLATAAGLLLSCSLGCSSATPVELISGTGTIQLDGQPLEAALVEFQPENGSPSYGLTDSAGKYRLQYSREQAGVMPGTHTVRIRTSRSEVDEDGHEHRVPEKLLPRYHDQSELTAVVDDENNSFDFSLTSRK